MPLSELCQEIETTALGKAIPHFTWLWPAIESLHVATMVVLVASIAAFDLRLIGIALRHLRVSEIGRRLLPATWMAFGVMIATGTFLFIPFALRKYCFNSSFQIKLILIALAGINMSLFHLTVYRDVSQWDENSSTPLRAKLAGSISVLLWAGVVVAGRLIGFV